MALRLNVNGKTVNGTITLNYKTKHDSYDTPLVTKGQAIRFNEVPIELVEADIASSVTIRIQARARKLALNEARGLTAKAEMDYMESRTKLVAVRKMSMQEMISYLKDHPEEREALLAELED